MNAPRSLFRSNKQVNPTVAGQLAAAQQACLPAQCGPLAFFYLNSVFISEIAESSRKFSKIHPNLKIS
jgi:hypothetical protein